MPCIVFLFALFMHTKAEIASFDGYYYPKPETKLCLDGTIRAFCDEPKHCPPGFLGFFPNCYPPKLMCPEGTHLEASYYGDEQCIADVAVPNQSPPQCPLGTIGIYPDCHRQIVQQECPFGTIGNYPYCQTQSFNCPTGTTGLYPNCQPLNVNICPPGTAGTYPYCNHPLRVSQGYDYPKMNIPYIF